MVSYKLLTHETDIDRAYARARASSAPVRANSVEYRPGPGLDLFIVRLNDGQRRAFPRELLEGLAHVPKNQAAEVKLEAGGLGLRWPKLDIDHYVPDLWKGIYGSSDWMIALEKAQEQPQGVRPRDSHRQRKIA